MTSRRQSLLLLGAAAGCAAGGRALAQAFPGRPHQYPAADPAYRMRFPRDFGAHDDFRTEWWYLTGWLDERLGFQVTFFRVRTSHPDENPSRFAPTQLLFAHAALMRPDKARALHEQRAGRIGSPGARYSLDDTDVSLGDWRLWRQPDDRYRAVIPHQDFSLDLTLTPPGAPGDPSRRPWLQGDRGFSRKGPLPDQASHYYSRVQLQVSGRVDNQPVKGIAWFDHEWSTTVLDPSAEGWDWTGINLDDGSALVAFRIRRRRDPAAAAVANAPPLWTYCALQHPDGRTEEIAPVRFDVLRTWQSPRTLATYPVAMALKLPGRRLRLEPLFDDQELDGRGSTGTVYWEGAVRVLDANGQRLGLGYLELTGYHTPIRL